MVLSCGYFAGLGLTKMTTKFEAQGIVSHYNGNEADESAVDMKFKKSAYEILQIVHTHMISMAIIFLILALLVYGTAIPWWFKKILLFEPMCSVLCTFGGIYAIWLGFEGLRYIVMISGILMTCSYVCSVGVILYSLLLRHTR